ncbi:hypothetical protein [Streptosporangium sp. NPDC004631]
MRGRVQVWGGAVVAVTAVAALSIYLERVGLDNADKLASVMALFVALAGLGVTVYSMIADRNGSNGEHASQGASTPDERAMATGGDSSEVVSPGDGTSNIQMNAEASGQGRIYQAGHDQTINER